MTLTVSPATVPLHRSRTNITVPRGFNFWRTAFSHGWCSLPPFTYAPELHELERTLELRDGAIVHAVIRSSSGGVSALLSSASPLNRASRAEASSQIRTCLRLDEDYTAFYREAGRFPEDRWIRSSGAGRMLRAPTAFEDAVKIICTTNCTWRLTTIMVTNLTLAAGRTDDGAHYTFPSAAAIASMSERDLRTRCTTGYRAGFIRELAVQVASGALDIEGWRHSPLPTGELEHAIRSVKGMGPYAAGNMLRLVGRYNSLALDSWVRARYYQLHKHGRKVSDAVIERHYDRYGEWRGLIFWLEMTRYWHEDKFTL